MSRKVVHYNPPHSQFSACNLGDNPVLTKNLDDVTCMACLRTEAVKKHGGGRPRQGEKPKEPTSVRLPPDLKQQALAADLNMSQLLEEAIEQKLNPAPEQEPSPIDEEINRFLMTLKPVKSQRIEAMKWFDKFRKFLDATQHD